MKLNWRRPISTSRRRVFMYSVALGALGASCSEAWAIVTPRGSAKAGKRCCQQLSPHRYACGRRRPSPPSSRGNAKPAVSQSFDDQPEGTAPPPRPLEAEPVVAVEAGGGQAAGSSSSWQEQFASLWNDAADPWTARSADDGGSSTGTGSAQEQPLPVSPTAVREEVAGVEPPPVSTATETTVVPEEAAPAPAPARAESTVAEEAAELMSSRGVSDAAAAYRAYLLLDAELTGALEPSSSSPPPAVSSLRRSTAEALLSWIRSSTAGNGLVVDDGGQVATADTEERRKLWAEHAPRVLQLVKDIGDEPSSDPELQQIYTEATMYSVASQGILEAFVSGKALAFTSAVTVLVKKFPAQDNGVAFIFQGSYFLAAPWPVRSAKKALACYEKAVEINGRSRRNVYYAGLGRLACGDRRGAREMFSRAISDEDCESASPTERDIAVPVREQAQRGLDACG